MKSIKRLLSHAEFVVGALLVLAFAAVAAAAPLLAPPVEEDPYQLPQYGYASSPIPPSAEHPLGLMQGQYDTLYGMIWGARTALRAGLLITLGRAVVGILIGAVAGYYGGMLDALLMRITDAFLAFPVVTGVMLTFAVFVSDELSLQLGQGDTVLMAALAVFGWMQYARVVRGNVLAERTRDYVQAAVSVGAPNRRIIFRHVLPNSTQGLLVLITSDVGTMVVTVAALTFIGLAGNEPVADWGMMLKYSRNWLIGTPANAFQYWYTYVPPLAAIALFSVGWNLVGDGLREALDPRLRGLSLSIRSRRAPNKVRYRKSADSPTGSIS
ncbi:MAG: ABC transporter permease [Anaerolineales bacterium]|nr:ABC transporter permease [Anaerolineales bacterium]